MCGIQNLKFIWFKKIKDRKILWILVQNEYIYIYIYIPGASGKTFVYKNSYNLLTAKNITVCSMAFTGIGAILLPNGRTVNKTFGLPVPMFDDSSSNINLLTASMTPYGVIP